MSNAPAYKGTGQPALAQSAGWLGRLGQLLGQDTAPAYHGTGQPALRSQGPFANAAPVYRQAPATEPMDCPRDEEVTKPDGTSVLQAALVCPADCDPFAQGPIAIIVPRQG